MINQINKQKIFLAMAILLFTKIFSAARIVAQEDAPNNSENQAVLDDKLFESCSSGNLELTKELIAKGANYKQVRPGECWFTPNGVTNLAAALVSGNRELVEFLATIGLKPIITHELPVHMVELDYITSQLLNKQEITKCNVDLLVKAIDLLITLFKVSPDMRIKRGDMLLHRACKIFSVDLVDLLFKHKVSVFWASDVGYSSNRFVLDPFIYSIHLARQSKLNYGKKPTEDNLEKMKNSKKIVETFISKIDLERYNFYNIYETNSLDTLEAVLERSCEKPYFTKFLDKINSSITILSPKLNKLICSYCMDFRPKSTRNALEHFTPFCKKTSYLPEVVSLIMEYLEIRLLPI